MSAPNSSLLSAIERAKQVAAKLSQQLPNTGGVKRSGDSDGESPGPKKFANISDAVGASLSALKAQINTSQVTEEYKVPDKLVGLVIGKGGEQIQKLQGDAGCKVVVQTESSGQPYRVCTLSGSKESVDRAKRLIDDIIQRGATDSSMLPAGQEVLEIRVPGNKCGLVIGKNGETIKRLAEQYGVKLVVVQESNSASSSDKPLRITGETERVQRCKDAVLQMISPKGPDQQNNKFSTNEYGSKRDQYQGSANGQMESYIRVASDKAGIVIGKGGETIKDINRRSGAVCEIDKAYRNTEGPDKFFFVRGTYDQIMYCQQLIYEKITGNVGQQPSAGFFGPNALQPHSGYSPNESNSNQGYGAWGYPTSPNSNAAVDPMAAWAAYYQYYQQAGATQQQQGNSTPTSQSQTAAAQPNAQAGQPDYSMAWVEYYRSIGMHAEAEAILKQTQGTASTTNTSASTTTTTTTTASSSATSTSTSSSASSSTSAAAAAQAAAWQNYAAYGYAGYPGYTAPQTQ